MLQEGNVHRAIFQVMREDAKEIINNIIGDLMVLLITKQQ